MPLLRGTRQGEDPDPRRGPNALTPTQSQWMGTAGRQKVGQTTTQCQTSTNTPTGWTRSQTISLPLLLTKDKPPMGLDDRFNG